MSRYVITVETDNPRAREHIRRLTENCLAGVDLDKNDYLHDTTITAVEVHDDQRFDLIWQTNLQPDNEVAR